MGQLRGQTVSSTVSRVYLRICSLAFGALLSIEIATGVSKGKERQRRRYLPPGFGPMFHECYIESTDNPERLRRPQFYGTVGSSFVCGEAGIIKGAVE